VSRKADGADSAVVRWVRDRRRYRAGGRQVIGWALDRRVGPPRRRSEVHVAHIHRDLGARRLTVRWLDEETRRLIAPLALWDITDQLEDAAALFRLRARS
jgi:hypothetical protein